MLLIKQHLEANSIKQIKMGVVRLWVKSMISFKSNGNWKKTDNWMAKMSRGDFYKNLDTLATRGKNALSTATPVDSGKTAALWNYKIENKRGRVTITWYNDHVVNGVPIAIILQYGHGTGTGGYVSGRDYINPAIQPVMDKIADQIWKEVTK